MNADTPRTAAVRREVKNLRRLYRHLATYLIVVSALAAINLLTAPHRLWVMYVALGWGIAIAVHAARALLFGRYFGPEWEEKEVARRLADKG